jgi:hypothetical protein
VRESQGTALFLRKLAIAVGPGCRVGKRLGALGACGRQAPSIAFQLLQNFGPEIDHHADAAERQRSKPARRRDSVHG